MFIIAFGTNIGEQVQLWSPVVLLISHPYLRHVRIGAGTSCPPFLPPLNVWEQLQWHWALTAGLQWMPAHSELEGLSRNWQYPELGLEDCIWKRLIGKATVTRCWATRKLIFHKARKLDTIRSRPLVTSPESRIHLFNLQFKPVIWTLAIFDGKG